MNKLTIIIISIAMGGFALFGLGISVAELIEVTDPSEYGMVLLIMIAVLINAFIVFQLLPMDKLKASAHFRKNNYNKIYSKKMTRSKPFVEHAQFEQIYSELQDKYQVVLNKARRPLAITRVVQILSALIAIGAFFMYYSTLKMEYGVVLLAAVAWFAISIFLNTQDNIVDEYKKTYMETVFLGMIDRLDTEELDKLEISESYNIIYSTQKIKNSTINYMKDPPTYENFGKRMMEINIYEGIMARLNVDKGIGAEISIVSNVDEAHYTREDRLKKIEMDSGDFESMYNLYSDNKVIATRLITSEVLELLARAKMFLGLDIRISIVNKKITLQIPMYDVISLNILKRDLDKELLIEYFEIIKIIRKIMLNLYNGIQNLEV